MEQCVRVQPFITAAVISLVCASNQCADHWSLTNNQYADQCRSFKACIYGTHILFQNWSSVCVCTMQPFIKTCSRKSGLCFQPMC